MPQAMAKHLRPSEPLQGTSPAKGEAAPALVAEMIPFFSYLSSGEKRGVRDPTDPYHAASPPERAQADLVLADRSIRTKCTGKPGGDAQRR